MSTVEDYNNTPTEPRGLPQRPAPVVPAQASIPAKPARAGASRVSRRALLGASLAGAAALGVGGVALGEFVQQSAQQQGPPAGSAQLGHLLRRAGFGASAADLSNYRSLSYSAAVDRLVNYTQVSDDATERRLAALNLDLSKPVEQQRWWLLRMAWTQRPLLEKMTLFWHGVLTSSFRKAGGSRYRARMLVQNQFLRAHAFDTYDAILLGITSDPAMLVYLDLTTSKKNAPNENYARELMELFTLGLGNYTQQDVFEGAAALTGWHARGLTSRYLPATHNDLTKTYLKQTGNFDYRDVVRLLTNHPALPWFICRKLFTFFAYESPSAADLKPLVDTYVESGHNMGQVLRTLLLSAQFTSGKAYRSRVKSPVEFAVGVYRGLNVQGSGVSLPTFTTLMGQTIFDPPNVAGWPGDKVSSLWLNSGTWMTRLNYTDALLTRGLAAPRDGSAPYDLQGVVDANAIDSPERFVDYFASFLLDGVIALDRRAQLIDYFTTSDVSRGDARITLKNGRSYPLNRVRGTLYLLLALPEYQLN